jgi:ribosome maturation factor RimP
MLQDQIAELIQPTIQALGYELWGCEYLAQGKHSLLRIYIDQDTGIGISDCEKVSKQVSALLDVEDLIVSNYSLEVSSPGIPRPLFYLTQYKRYIGQEVSLKLFKPFSGRRQWVGIILSADEKELVLDIDAKQQKFLFSNIVKAHLTSKRGE